MSSKAPSSTKSDAATGPGESGIEAGIIFVMVVVFLGIIFLNTYFSHGGLENSLAQARGFMQQGEYATATARLDEVLSQYPAHEIAQALKLEAEGQRDHKLEELRKERERAEENASRLESVDLALAETSSERDELKGVNRALESNLEQMQTRLSKLGKRYSDLESAATGYQETSEKRLADVSDQLRKLEGEGQQLMAAVAAAEKRSAVMSTEFGEQITQLSTDLEESEKQARGFADKLKSSEQKRRSAESELNKTTQDLEHMRAAHGALQRSAATAEDEAQMLTARLAKLETATTQHVTQLVADGKKSQEAGDHAIGMLAFGYALLLDPDNPAAKRGHKACKQVLEDAEKERKKAEEENKKAEEDEDF